MNRREYEILTRVLQDPIFYDINQLSKSLEKTERTIRNDLLSIQTFLSENQIPKIIITEDGHLQIPIGYERQILTLLEQMNFYTYGLNAEEREIIMILLLCCNSNYQTLSDMADFMSVSRSTMIKDLANLKEHIKEEQVKVFSHPNKGIQLIGSELQIREVFCKILLSDTYLVNLFIKKYLDDLLIGNFDETKSILQKIVWEIEEETSTFLVDNSFYQMILYLLFMLIRLNQAALLEKEIPTPSRFESFATLIYTRVAQYFDGVENIHEIHFIQNLCYRLRFTEKTTSKNSFLYTQILTRNLIQKISEELHQNLNGDYRLFESLSRHLEDVLYHTNESLVSYPELTLLMEKNENVVQAIEASTSELEEYINRKLSKVEIAYIVTYICTSLEKKDNNKEKFSVLVVCNSGIGTSQLLKVKLEKEFSFWIKGIISTHQLDKVNLDDIDFLITTVPVKNISLPLVTVTSSLSEIDQLRIQLMLSNLPPKEKKARPLSSKIDQLTRTIEPHVSDYPGLIEKIHMVIKEYAHTYQGKTKKLLSDYLTPAFIELDVVATNWEEAVKKSASILRKKEMITDDFVENIIESIQENGPYVVISEGFAFPHAGFDQGAIETGFSLIRLQTPVTFDSEFDPVKWVCTLSAGDNEKHLTALFSLVNILNVDCFRTALEQVSSPEQIHDLLLEYEQ